MHLPFSSSINRWVDSARGADAGLRRVYAWFCTYVAVVLAIAAALLGVVAAQFWGRMPTPLAALVSILLVLAPAVAAVLVSVIVRARLWQRVVCNHAVMMIVHEEHGGRIEQCVQCSHIATVMLDARRHG